MFNSIKARREDRRLWKEVAKAMVGDGWFDTPQDAWNAITDVAYENVLNHPEGLSSPLTLTVQVGRRIGVPEDLLAEIERQAG